MKTSTVNGLVYDFEEYVHQHGIPATQDPLPFRKPASVFNASESSLTSAKHDPRLRTVVCRHWLRGLCMKGSACEFLHRYDLSKMPFCHRGDQCMERDCPLKHIKQENKLECVFYSQGFCRHGRFCKYKHSTKDRTDLPLVADFETGLAAKRHQIVMKPMGRQSHFRAAKR